MANDSTIATPLLEEDQSQELCELPTSDKEILDLALVHYKRLVNLTDQREIKISTKKLFRDNAMTLLQIITSQSNKIAQLEGRIEDLNKINKPEHIPINPRTANSSQVKEVHSFTSVVAKNTVKHNKLQTAIPKPRKQHLAVIRPVNDQSTSQSTKQLVQKNIDINRMNIGVKRVSHIRNGGILIETVAEKDLAKLMEELEANTEINKNCKVDTPIKRNPQFVCYGVAEETTEDMVANCIRHQCQLGEERPTMASKFVPFPFHGGHLNLGNARAAMAFLNNAISTYGFDFFSINEPYTFDNNITSISINYSIALLKQPSLSNLHSIAKLFIPTKKL
ncbi:hypothetical protein CDAR_453251 [Caerostris darwini]|uniref:Uncharacterized protein n=1 Tax=Caerostris darwini TaxID=1538125 RepID=A0AAV4RWZ5_9ARAC|nr:hypothetical protein CDAR_453251 [Caerostris darwini]